MRIPKDVILIWTGTNASIPSNWIRETSLDDKFIKGWGNQNPNETGGSLTHNHQTNSHSHTLETHTHSYTLSGSSGYVDENRPYGTSSPQPITAQHEHSGTTGQNTLSTSGATSFTTGTGSNLPPFFEVIFIKSNGNALLSNDIIALFDKTTIPTGWQECNGSNGTFDLRNKYLKGASPNSDAGNTGGSLNHSHSLSHSHSGASHNHGQTTSNYASNYIPLGNTGSWYILQYNHTHTFSVQDTFVNVNDYNQVVNFSENIEPEYKKLIAIQNKTGTFSKPKNIIGLWLGSVSSLPKGWFICDGSNGTIDLRNKFIKIANDTSEIGESGGQNSHSHANHSHFHTSPPHTHSIPSIDHYDGVSHLNVAASGGYYDALRTDIHIIHNTSTMSAMSPNWTSTDIVFQQADNQPPYLTVAYIQFKKEVNQGGAMLNFL